MTTAQPRRLGFAFGPRFFALWGAGCLLALAGWDRPWLAPWLGAWSCAVLALWLVDLGRLPPPSALAAERQWPERIEIGAEARLRLRIANHGRCAIRLQATDDIPPALSGREEFTPREGRIAADAAEQMEQCLHPWQRGDHAVGDLHLRYRSRWELAERWARVPLAEKRTVYPNWREARRDALLLTRSQQIQLERKLARRTGQGREFHHLREYREGDDVRDIHWPASARRGQALVQVRREERRQPVWVVLDCGRLLRARVVGQEHGESSSPARPGPAPLEQTIGRTKLDGAVSAGLSLAGTALNLGDAVGLLAYGAEVRRLLPPEAGAAQLRRIYEQLAGVSAEPVEAAHRRAAARLLGAQRRRALILWLTDFNETTLLPEVIEAAAALTARHLVLFVAIRQSDLEELASQELEDPHALYVAAAARQMAQRRETQLAQLRRRGALALELPSTALAATVVSRYLEIKQTGRL